MSNRPLVDRLYGAMRELGRSGLALEPRVLTLVAHPLTFEDLVLELTGYTYRPAFGSMTKILGFSPKFDESMVPGEMLLRFEVKA